MCMAHLAHGKVYKYLKLIYQKVQIKILEMQCKYQIKQVKQEKMIAMVKIKWYGEPETLLINPHTAI